MKEEGASVVIGWAFSKSIIENITVLQVAKKKVLFGHSDKANSKTNPSYHKKQPPLTFI